MLLGRVSESHWQAEEGASHVTGQAVLPHNLSVACSLLIGRNLNVHCYWGLVDHAGMHFYVYQACIPTCDCKSSTVMHHYLHCPCNCCHWTSASNDMRSCLLKESNDHIDSVHMPEVCGSDRSTHPEFAIS